MAAYSAPYLRRIWSFSRALDLALVDEEIERGFQVAVGQRHGERVAYIALYLGRQMGLSRAELFNLTVAGLLHDIGAIADFRHSHGDPKRMIEHSVIGAAMLKKFPTGEFLAPALRYHHETPLTQQHGTLGNGSEVPLFAKILSLADKLDIQMPRRLLTMAERERISQWVAENSGHQVFPELAAVFLQVAHREAFWLDLDQPDLPNIVCDYLFGAEGFVAAFELEADITHILADTFAGLVDQKSNYTSRHSHSVAETAQRLALGLGWNEVKQQDIYTAGLLHDLGKLAVPNKILDKPGKLEAQEFEVIRMHTYYTYRLLLEAGFPRRIVEWAAYHHERLDGRGYPFGLAAGELDMGARLMKIADIFAALTEERPYRKALSSGEALDIIQRETGSSVDADLVEQAIKVLVISSN